VMDILSDENRIDVSGLMTGVYFVRGEDFNYRFVISH